MAAATQCAICLNGFEAFYSHDKCNVCYRAQWTPVDASGGRLLRALFVAVAVRAIALFYGAHVQRQQMPARQRHLRTAGSGVFAF